MRMLKNSRNYAAKEREGTPAENMQLIRVHPCLSAAYCAYIVSAPPE
jgi:hypothetical protein